MKATELLVVTDNIDEAIKFYTEKLTFDVVKLELSTDNSNTLSQVQLKKGANTITFRLPYVEELVEFSFIKRCGNRCVEIFINLKKGVDKLFLRCQKKGVKIVSDPKNSSGHRQFSIKDPLGIRVTFSEVIDTTFVGPTQLEVLGLYDKHFNEVHKDVLIEKVIDRIARFNIIRRPAKKYASFVVRILHKSLAKKK